MDAASPKVAPLSSGNKIDLPTTAKTHAEIAVYFEVSVPAVRKWAEAGMPGSKGSYDLQQIAQWRLDNQKRNSTTWPEHLKDFAGDETPEGSVTNAAERLRLTTAQADKEEELVKRAIRENELAAGTFVDREQANLLFAEFFTEMRQRLGRVPIEMAAGYSQKLQQQIRDDLQGRHDLFLKHMHNWVLRVEELEAKTE